MFSQKTQGKPLQFTITAACGAGFLLFGYDQGVFGGLLDNVETFGNPGATIQGQIVATYDLGCIIGALGSMFCGDKLGRRRCILLGCCILIVGAVLQTASYTLAQMIVGRVVAGVGNGMNTVAITVWQSETARAKDRGKLIVAQLVTNIFGVVITNWMNYGFTFIPHSDVSWRLPLAFQCFFAIATISLVTVGLRYGGKDNKGMSILAVVFIFAYYIFYGLSLLSIPYMYPAEINSQKMRNIGTSFATTVNWVFVYLVVVVTPTAIENISWRYYMLYAIFNVCSVPVIWWFYAETANLSLKQVDRLFEVKYEAGKGMSWSEATRIARTETGVEFGARKTDVEHCEDVATDEHT